MTKPTAYLLALLLASAAAAAQAQNQAASAPAPAPAQAAPQASSPAAKANPADEPSTQVTSDTLRYDDAQRQSIFTGNVVATRGKLNIYSDKLVVSEDKDGNQYGTATADKGKVVTITEDRPETYEHIEGKGLRGEYDGKKQQFDLIGQAVVIRYICGKPFDTIRGERVRYYQKTDVYEAQGGPGSAGPDGRVRSVAEPRAKAQAAMDACSAQHGKPAAAKKPAPAKK
jgi:lipopolysaccharide export system protein LptA